MRVHPPSCHHPREGQGKDKFIGAFCEATDQCATAAFLQTFATGVELTLHGANGSPSPCKCNYGRVLVCWKDSLLQRLITYRQAAKSHPDVNTLTVAFTHVTLVIFSFSHAVCEREKYVAMHPSR